jgi:hypothetical protein
MLLVYLFGTASVLAFLFGGSFFYDDTLLAYLEAIDCFFGGDFDCFFATDFDLASG